LKGNPPSCLYGLLLRDDGGRPVAFHGVGLQVGRGFTNMSMRESRLVVLPDSQGLGLGPRLSNCVGGLLVRSGCELLSRTAHPRLGAYREAKPSLWAPTSTNRKASTSSLSSGFAKTRRRLSVASLGGATQADLGASAAAIALAELAELADAAADVAPDDDASAPPDPACRRCQQDLLRAEGRGPSGRPPNHTCGRAKPARTNAKQKKVAIAVCDARGDEGLKPKARVCFSHKYCGGPWQPSTAGGTPEGPSGEEGSLRTPGCGGGAAAAVLATPKPAAAVPATPKRRRSFEDLYGDDGAPRAASGAKGPNPRVVVGAAPRPRASPVGAPRPGLVRRRMGPTLPAPSPAPRPAKAPKLWRAGVLSAAGAGGAVARWAPAAGCTDSVE